MASCRGLAEFLVRVNIADLEGAFNMTFGTLARSDSRTFGAAFKSLARVAFKGFRAAFASDFGAAFLAGMIYFGVLTDCFFLIGSLTFRVDANSLTGGTNNLFNTLAPKC